MIPPPSLLESILSEAYRGLTYVVGGVLAQQLSPRPKFECNCPAQANITLVCPAFAIEVHSAALIGAIFLACLAGFLLGLGCSYVCRTRTSRPVVGAKGVWRGVNLQIER